MRAAKVGFLGLSALLSARIIAGCSSGQGEAGFDAGSLDELELPAQDAGTSDDAGLHLQAEGGGDATVANEDAATSSNDAAPADDGETDSALTEGGDAGDAATGSADASDGAVAAGHDAGDAATTEVDAGDASTAVDAGVGDAGAPDSGGSDATVADAGNEDASSGEDAGSSEDAGFDAAPDASDAAVADAAPACVSCGTILTFLGNTAAYQTGTGNSVALQNGTVVDGASVSVVTQTYPQNAVAQIHLLYSTDPAFASPADLVMTFDHTVGNNDQWYAILPVESANTTVYWYMRADGCDCATSLYGQPGPLQNYSYTEQ